MVRSSFMTTQPVIPVDISVIVPCRNEVGTIAGCVASILDQEIGSERMEVIIADGQSTDGTRQVLDDLVRLDARVRVLSNPRLIVSTGLNAGIEAARGNIIIRMDAHTTYERDYVAQCLAVLRDSGADNVGGPALTVAHGVLQRAIALAYHSPFAVGGARFHNPAYEGWVDTVPYGCWPRAVFSRIGLFDEELVRNQDDEFNLRLTRAGGRIYQSPRIRSWYRPRGSLYDLFLQYRQYGYWKVRVIQKHKVPASLRHLVPAGFVLVVAVLAITALWSKSAVWMLIAVAGAYLLCTVAAAVIAGGRQHWPLIPLLPFVFVTYHLSYGLGFLQGLWDCVVMHRKPSRSLVNLSRRPVG